MAERKINGQLQVEEVLVVEAEKGCRDLQQPAPPAPRRLQSAAQQQRSDLARVRGRRHYASEQRTLEQAGGSCYSWTPRPLTAQGLVCVCFFSTLLFRSETALASTSVLSQMVLFLRNMSLITSS